MKYNSKAVRGVLAALAIVVVGSGCTVSVDRPEVGRKEGPPAAIGAALDLGAIPARVEAAFRPRDGGFEALGRNHRGVVREGKLRLEARSAPSSTGTMPAFSVAATKITRGKVVLSPRREAPELRGDAVVSRDGPIREVIRNTADGVEQLFEVEAPPAASGELVVRIPVSGQIFRAMTASGVHFTDPATGLGTRYGHGTWVDAAGHRTRIAAAFERSEIVLRVPDALLAGSAYPAVLDPLISPEFGIDTPVAGTPAYYTWHTAAARAGGTYLVVWSDSRADRHVEVYGARVDAASGNVLDPTGFLIAERAYRSPLGVSAGPAYVTSNGKEFLVVFDEVRDETTQVNVYARRVRTDGTVLDGGPSGAGLLVAGRNDFEVPIAPYFDGKNYLVPFFQYVPSTSLQPYDLHAARLDGQTAALLSGSATSGGRLLMGQVYDGRTPAYATDATNVLVVYGDQFVLLGPDGALLGPAQSFTWMPGTKAPGAAGDSAIRFDGTNYVVMRAEGNSTIRASRITRAGQALDLPDDFNLLPGGYLVCDRTSFNSYQSFGTPKLFETASGPVLVWSGGSTSNSTTLAELYGSRLDATGHLLDGPTAGFCGIPLGLSVPTPIGPFTIEGGSDGFIAVQNALGRRYSSALQPLGPVQQVVVPAATQEKPVVASNGKDFLVAWLEHRSLFGDADIYASRVSADGTVLDPVAIPISTFTSTNLPTSLSIASNGKDYMVTWLTRQTTSNVPMIRGTRVTAQGVALDGQPENDRVGLVQFATNVDEVAVGSDGVNYLVAWTNSYPSWTVYGARFDSSGSLIQSSGTDWIPIASEGLQGKNLRIASDRNADPALRTYLVVWERESTQNEKYIHVIQAARVRSALGRFVGSAVVGSGGDYAATPTVAGDATGFLVAWRPQMTNKGPENLGDYDVVGTHIAALDGAASAQFDIGTSPYWADSPSLAHDGKHYWASWAEHQQPDLDTNLRATRLDSSGALLDGPAPSGAFRVSSIEPLPGPTPQVSSASNAKGQVLVVYTTFDTRNVVRQTRVRARILQDSPLERDAGIVFQPTPRDAEPDGTSSNGGASGTGGTTSNGGAGNTGGTTSNGGASGSSGTTSNGGASGSGGTTSNGGASGSGGTTSNGGASGSGGTTSNGGAGGSGGTTSNGGATGADAASGGTTTDSGATGSGGEATSGGATGADAASGGTTNAGGNSAVNGGATSGSGGVLAAGAAGRAGSGAVATRDAGPTASPDGSSDRTEDKASDSSGCDCRVGGARSTRSSSGALLLTLLAVAAARRRSRGRGDAPA